MKNTARLFLSICFLGCSFTNAQQDSPLQSQNNNVIQLALLLDVSSSMDGLIDQAKSELWSIVNEVAIAKKNQTNAKLEIALYEYGRSSNNVKEGYIVKLLDYTSDLDSISKILFSLSTNGGNEYCGQVIGKALEELQWKDNPDIYRVIFIAGNEPFNQGSVSYKTSCEEASQKGIYINTIHCGDSLTGIRTFWKEGASIGNGDYFFINQNSKAYDMPTPYDSMMGVYNDSLNAYYWNFGDAGLHYKNNQMLQDNNAKAMGSSVKAKRAVSKTTTMYSNATWDAVDAAAADSNWIKETDEKDLPENLKGKTMEEKKIALDSASSARQYFAKKIQELNRLRQMYLRNHKPIGASKTLGEALIEAIHRQAMSKGFVFI